MQYIEFKLLTINPEFNSGSAYIPFSFFAPFKNVKTGKNFHCLYVKDNDEDLDELDYEDFSAFTEQIETSTK